MLKKLTALVATLAMLLVASVPVLALSLAFDSCADVDSIAAQNALESPEYQMYGDENLAHLDPDGDGIACNNEGNFAGGGGDSILEDDEVIIGPGQTIDCGSVFSATPELKSPFDEISSPVETSPEAEEELRRLCVDNGYAPNTGAGGMQYDNTVNGSPELRECFERAPDGFCTYYVATDGSIVNATPPA